jgi:hypothetical protein
MGSVLVVRFPARAVGRWVFVALPMRLLRALVFLDYVLRLSSESDVQSFD